MVAQLIHPSITVLVQSWLCRASGSPGTPHSTLERLGVGLILSTTGQKTYCDSSSKPGDSLETRRLLIDLVPPFSLFLTSHHPSA